MNRRQCSLNLLIASGLLAASFAHFSSHAPQALAQNQAQLVPDMMNALGVPYTPAVEHALQESDRRQMEKRYGLPHERSIPFWERKRGENGVQDSRTPSGGASTQPSLFSDPFADPLKDGSVGEIDESNLDELCNPTPPNVGKSMQPATTPDLCKRLRPQASTIQSSQWPAQLQNPSAADLQNDTSATPGRKLPTVRIGGYIPAQNEKPMMLIDKQGKQILQPGLYKHVSKFSQKLASVLVAPLNIPELDTPENIPEAVPQNTSNDQAAEKKLLAFTDSAASASISDLSSNTAIGADSKVAANPLKPRFGYIDALGQLAVTPRFEMAGDFKRIGTPKNAPLYARVKWANPGSDHSQWGYIDQRGNVVIENRFDWAGDFSEGLAIVSLPMDNSAAAIAGKPDELVPHQYGFIDRGGNVVIAPQYDEAEPFSNGLAKVWSAQMSNSQLINLSLDKPLVEGDADARPNLNAHGWPQYRFITPSGETAFEPAYDWVSSFENGFARVGFLGDARDSHTRSTTPSQLGYINKQGVLLIPIVYENAWPFVSVETMTLKKPPTKMTYAQRVQWKKLVAAKQNVMINKQLLALVKQNGKYGYITASGNFAFPDRFEWAEEFHENLAAVRIGDKYGFIMPNGKFAISPRFDWVGNFSEGLAAIARKTPEGLQYGFIDRSGKTVISTQYSWVTPFTDGIAQVRE
ncbi:MAG: WG repeat-containing protein [Vampirovibrionales bacterium]|nr:WG repeat-containing protein [Vampirovibrionales bacterium]